MTLSLIQPAAFLTFHRLQRALLIPAVRHAMWPQEAKKMQFHDFVSRGHIRAEIKFEWCWDTPWFPLSLLALSLFAAFWHVLLALMPCWCKRWQGLLTEAECECIEVWSAQVISCESRVRYEGLCYQLSSLGFLYLPVSPLIELQLRSALHQESNNVDNKLHLSRSDSICVWCVCVCMCRLITHFWIFPCPDSMHLWL